MATEIQPIADQKAIFCRSVVASFEADPAARDYAIAETLYLLTELHASFMGAFNMVTGGKKK